MTNSLISHCTQLWTVAVFPRQRMVKLYSQALPLDQQLPTHAMRGLGWLVCQYESVEQMGCGQEGHQYASVSAHYNTIQ